MVNLKPLCKLHHQLKTNKYWTVEVHPDGSETWTSLLGFTYTSHPAHFPLPEPLDLDDEPPAEINDRLPDTFDPDPPRDDEPLPEPPDITDEQYHEISRAIDSLALLHNMTFREWCNRHYDEARRTGLVA